MDIRRVAQTVLTVFLSSTAADLQPHREAVYKRLSKAGLFQVLRMEDFGAQDADGVTVCEREVKKADLFVGLVGMRRGWEPDGDAKNRSITEMEHDWAHASGCDCFLHVSPRNFPVPGDLYESPDAHQRQLAFRKRIMGDRVVEHDGFGSPELLASAVAENLLKRVIADDALLKIVRPELAKIESNVGTSDELPDVIAAKLVAALDARGEVARADEGGVHRLTVFELARRLKPSEVLDFEQAQKELNAAIDIAINVTQKGGQLGNYDNIVNSVRTRIAEKTAAGDIVGAAQEADRGFSEWESAEAERRDTAAQTGIAILEAGLEQDLLRRDAVAAAKRVQKISSLTYPNDHGTQFVALRAQQDDFYIRGSERGVNLALQVAVELARLTINVARTADERGAAWNDLGLALTVVGERESGTTRLYEAVEALREALKTAKRKRSAHSWAMTQNNIGNALGMIGDREGATKRLKEAVLAYRHALKEITRERAPGDWAMTQNNLGNALASLGREQSGTVSVKQAIVAYRHALEEWTRDREPLKWAITQCNLASALQIMGEKESCTTTLEEAIVINREALEELRRDRQPLDWALAQGNLGNSLFKLGKKEFKPELLEQAAEAYRAALDIYESVQSHFHIERYRPNLESTEELLVRWRREKPT